MKHWNRLLALLLAVCMVLTMLPTSFAEEADDSYTAASDTSEPTTPTVNPEEQQKDTVCLHNSTTPTAAVAATCTENGSAAYWTCNLCGRIFTDAECAAEITMADTVIPATRHTFDENVCTVCGFDLNEVIGYADVTLGNYDRDGNRLCRKQETNTGDFAADALYYLFDQTEGLDVDCALINGGALRNRDISGELSYLSCKSILTFGNKASLYTMTGQQILDALEWGARYSNTSECGGFQHVSGLTFEIDTTIENGCQQDDMFNWTAGPEIYRVKNVKIIQEGAWVDLDLVANYNIAGYSYELRDSGDGFAMFAGATCVKDDVMEDYMVLANYIKSFPVDEVSGLPTIDDTSIYTDVNGTGRIKFSSNNLGEDGDFAFSPASENGCASIVGYSGSETDLVIPSVIDSYTVTGIDDYVFYGCTELTSVSIPDSVTSIGGGAFSECSNLSSILVLNPTAVIYDSDDTLGVAGTTTIFGYADSTAEAYASKYGYSFTEIPACAHSNLTAVPEKASTCTEAGNGDCWVCDDCGMYFFDAEGNHAIGFTASTIPALGHDYHYSVTDNGLVYTCSRCQDSYTLSGQALQPGVAATAVIANAGDYAYFYIIPAYTESYEFFSSTSSDTYGYLYDAQGNQLSENDDSGTGTNFSVTYTLTAGEVYRFAARYYSTSSTGSFTVQLNINHDYITTVTQAATCVESGSANDICSICGEQATTVLAALGHDWDEGTVTAPASCTAEGSIRYSCTRCEETMEETIATLGHTPDSGTVTLEPTCTTPGSINYTCTVCGVSYTQVLARLPHSFTDGLCTVCGNCGGSCGTNVSWMLDTDNGVLTIYGSGNMTNYSVNTYKPWDGYRSFLHTVIIEDGVTSIGNSAFNGCTGLTNVTISDSVTSIGYSAFLRCTGLTNMTIPDSVTRIEGDAFRDCTGLTNVTIPDSVIHIGSSVFHGCTGLTNVTIPDSVTNIGEWAFYNCSSLTSVSIPYSVTNIGSYTFYNCTGLTSVNIPASVTSIGEMAFSGCSSLSSILVLNPTALLYDSANTLGVGTTTIFGYADSTAQAYASKYGYSFTEIPDCAHSNLTAVPEKAATCTEAGNDAYWICDDCGMYFFNAEGNHAIGFTVSTIPALGHTPDSGTVTLEPTCTTPGSANYTCTVCGVSYTQVLARLPHSFTDGLCTVCGNRGGSCGTNVSWMLDTDNGVLTIYGSGNMTNYSINTYKPWDGYRSFVHTVVIEDGVTSIGDSAFNGCTGLTNVTISDSVTSIGHSAFLRCTGLTNMTIPDSVTRIGSSVFSSCAGLTSVSIGSSVSSIDSSAFEFCSGLTRITIPAGVTSIGSWAFSGCNMLRIAVIYNPDCEISSYAGFRSSCVFFGHPDSTAQTYAENNGNMFIPHILENGVCILCGETPTVSGECGDDASWSLNLASGRLTISGSGKMDSYTCGGPWESFNDLITSVEISEGITSIGALAFANGINLAEVQIPSTVLWIEELAFWNCRGLTEVTLPQSLTTIGSNAFMNCAALEEITIPASVALIGSHAFFSCNALTGIHVNSENQVYCNDAAGVLYNHSKTVLLQAPATTTGTFTIPGEVQTVFDAAFANCATLTGIVIPNSVTKIGKSAFLNCTGLKTVSIPGSIKSISVSMFEGCTGLSGITIPNNITKIGEAAFLNCTGLTTVTIPGSVKSIGNDAFYDCTGLVSVIVMNSTCFIPPYSRALGDPETTVISGNADSTAQTYAEQSGYAFSLIVDCENGQHSYVQTVITPATCLETGTASFTCSACGDTYTQELAALGHNYVRTFTNEGFVYTCSRCQDSYLLEIPVLVPETATQAVISGAGDYAYFAFTPAFTESYTFFSSGNRDTYGYLYDGQGNQLASDDDSGEGSNFSLTYTLTAGQVYQFRAKYYSPSNTGSFDVQLKTNHAYLQTVTQAPTCSEAGSENGVCTVCGAETTTVLQALGHDWDAGTVATAATCTESGSMLYSCTRCEETKTEPVAALGHAFDSGTVTLAPTCTTLGVESCTCTVCGEGCTQSIARLPHSFIDGICTVCGNRGGSCGTNVSWMLDTDSGVLTFYGSGNMTNFDSPWREFYDNIRTLIIEDGVTSIKDYAFEGCTNLTSASIPGSVTGIGYAAFLGCTNLMSLAIEDGVTYIGGSAFQGCTGLTSVVIPGSVTEIWYSAFFGCTNLMSLAIEDGVTYIGDSAFRNCTRLTSVSIPDSVTEISDCAFRGCTSLTSVSIGNSVTYIGDSAFRNCTRLTSVSIPDSVTDISDCAFQGCTSLTSVSIGNSVTYIGGSAFQGCTDLTGIWVDSANTAYSSDERGVLFNKDKTILRQAPAAISGAYTAPDSVTNIGQYAFENCSHLTDITFGDKAASISSIAFIGCSSLTGIWVDAANATYCSDEYGVLYNSDKTTVVRAPNAITGTYAIPDSVTSIGSSAFCDCEVLTSITIPDSVTSINSNAFSDCSSLTSIKIPSSVTRTGYFLFSNCSGLESVGPIGSNCALEYPWTTEIPILAFSGCSGLKNVEIPSSVTSIAYAAFISCSSLQAISIPDSVASIGEDAFHGCTGLTSVSIPDSVVSLGGQAFYGCTGLESVTLQDGIPEIGYGTFTQCNALTSITIPDSVTDIYWDAFSDCLNLDSMYFTGDAPALHSYWYDGIPDFAQEITLYYIEGKQGWHAVSAAGYRMALWDGNLLHEHSYTDTVIAPTCTEQGYTLHACFCGDSYKDTYVASLGHNIVTDAAVAATCTVDGLTEGSHCSRCDEVIVAQEIIPAAHQYVSVVTPPTATQEGYTTHTCSVCGDSYVDSIVPTSTPRIVVSSRRAVAGKTVTVSVSLVNNPGIVSAHLNLTYDTDKLTLTAVEDTGLLKGALFGEDMTQSPFALNWDDSTATQSSTQDGVIVNLTFEIKEDCVLGSVPITIVYTAGSIQSQNSQPILVEVEDGAVEVINRIAGDADGDGSVGAKDVAVLRRYLAHWTDVTIVEAAADVTGDGNVNATDVAILRRYLAHWAGVTLKSVAPINIPTAK